MIVDPLQAEAIVADRSADCVAFARAFLDDPRWARHAADALGADVACPPQYRRARPDQWPAAALARPPRGSLALGAAGVPPFISEAVDKEALR